ncbi:MAG: lysostaphin resistance A-like protein [Halobacteria archaeon]
MSKSLDVNPDLIISRDALVTGFVVGGIAGFIVWGLYGFVPGNGLDSAVSSTVFGVAPVLAFIAGAVNASYLFLKERNRRDVQENRRLDRPGSTEGKNESFQDQETVEHDETVANPKEPENEPQLSGERENASIGISGGLRGASIVPGFILTTVVAYALYSVTSVPAPPVYSIPVVGVAYPIVLGGVGGVFLSTRERFGKVVSSIIVTVGAFSLGLAIFAIVANSLRAIPATKELMSTTAAMFALSTILFQGVAFGSVAYIYLKVRSLNFSFLGFRKPGLKDFGWVFAGLFVLLIGANIIGLIFKQAGIQSAENAIQTQGMNNPEIFLIMIPLAFLLIGPGEEMLFRGVIQNSLKESFSPISAIVIASVIFAIGHYLALTGGGSKFATLAVIFILSLILGASYEITDNLWVSSLIHGGYDAILFTAMYFIATGDMGARF